MSRTGTLPPRIHLFTLHTLLYFHDQGQHHRITWRYFQWIVAITDRLWSWLKCLLAMINISSLIAAGMRCYSQWCSCPFQLPTTLGTFTKQTDQVHRNYLLFLCSLQDLQKTKKEHFMQHLEWSIQSVHRESGHTFPLWDILISSDVHNSFSLFLHSFLLSHLKGKRLEYLQC